MGCTGTPLRLWFTLKVGHWHPPRGGQQYTTHTPTPTQNSNSRKVNRTVDRGKDDDEGVGNCPDAQHQSSAEWLRWRYGPNASSPKPTNDPSLFAQGQAQELTDWQLTHTHIYVLFTPYTLGEEVNVKGKQLEPLPVPPILLHSSAVVVAMATVVMPATLVHVARRREDRSAREGRHCCQYRNRRRWR